MERLRDLSLKKIKLNKKKIKSIEEKPKYKIFVNSGIYMLDPKCIKLIPKKNYDMPQLFKKLIANMDNVISFRGGGEKSRNLSKIVSVLLSASVERFFVSRVRDFLHCNKWVRTLHLNK